MLTRRSVVATVAATAVLVLAAAGTASAGLYRVQPGWNNLGTHSAAKFTVNYSGGGYGQFYFCGQMKSSGGYRFDTSPCPPANGFSFAVTDAWCVNRVADTWVYNSNYVEHWVNVAWADAC